MTKSLWIELVPTFRTLRALRLVSSLLVILEMNFVSAYWTLVCVLYRIHTLFLLHFDYLFSLRGCCCFCWCCIHRYNTAKLIQYGLINVRKSKSFRMIVQLANSPLLKSAEAKARNNEMEEEQLWLWEEGNIRKQRRIKGGNALLCIAVLSRKHENILQRTRAIHRFIIFLFSSTMSRPLFHKNSFMLYRRKIDNSLLSKHCIGPSILHACDSVATINGLPRHSI